MNRGGKEKDTPTSLSFEEERREDYSYLGGGGENRLQQVGPERGVSFPKEEEEKEGDVLRKDRGSTIWQTWVRRRSRRRTVFINSATEKRGERRGRGNEPLWPPNAALGSSGVLFTRKGKKKEGRGPLFFKGGRGLLFKGKKERSTFLDGREKKEKGVHAISRSISSNLKEQ